MKNTVSLQLAKELKEAGWERSAEFNWIKMMSPGWTVLHHDSKFWELGGDEFLSDPIPAPTATELFEELPVTIKDGDDFYALQVLKRDSSEGDYYVAEYYWITEDCKGKTKKKGKAKTPADALAKLWLEVKRMEDGKSKT